MDKPSTFLQKLLNTTINFLNDSGDTLEQSNERAKKERSKSIKNKESKTTLIVSFLLLIWLFFYVLFQYYTLIRVGDDDAAAGLLLMLYGGNITFVSFVVRMWPYAILTVRAINRYVALFFLAACVFSAANLRLTRISSELLVTVAVIITIGVAIVLLDKSLTKTAIASDFLNAEKDKNATKKVISKAKKVATHSIVSFGLLLVIMSFVKPDFIHFSYNYVKAKQGKAEAAYNLGLYYTQYSEDYSQSFEWFKQAAKSGYSEAFSQLADHYIQGKGIAKNYQEAFNYLQKLRCDESEECQLSKFMCLGGILSEGGFGLELDYEYASVYYREAFTLNKSTVIALKIARLYEQHGKSYKARNWYVSAAELGSPIAKYELGKYYYSHKHYQKAYSYWLDADLLKHPLAKSRLSELYLQGYGVPQNLNKAQLLAVESLKENEAFSLYVIGTVQLYRLKKLNEKASIKLALQYLNKAFDKGSPEAALQLGYLYYFDELIAQNAMKAIEYFTYASEKNQDNASYYLAKIYEDGVGVSQNVAKAFEYYLMAEKKGNIDAGFKVGLYYDLGISVARSQEKAFDYYFDAANNSHYIANLHLAINNYQELSTAKNKAYESRLFSSLETSDYERHREWYQHIRAYEALTTYLQRAQQYGMEKTSSITPIISQILYNTAVIYADKSMHNKKIPGFFDAKRNLIIAERACLEAANANYPLAQYALATWYENGHFGSVEHEKSAYWLRKARKSGVAQPSDITIDPTKHFSG